MVLTQLIEHTPQSGVLRIDGSQNLIAHNLFLGNRDVPSIGPLQNANVVNNIFYGRIPLGEYSWENSTFTSFQHNLIIGNTSGNNVFPIGTNNNTGFGNLVGVDPQFVNLELTNSAWNYSWDATLKPGSPAIGAGTNGTDIGIFGGAHPFDYETILPLIQTLGVPGLINTGQDLDINIRARGNSEN